MLPNLAKKIRIASRDMKSFSLPDPFAEGIPSLRRTYRSTLSCSHAIGRVDAGMIS